MHSTEKISIDREFAHVKAKLVQLDGSIHKVIEIMLSSPRQKQSSIESAFQIEESLTQSNNTIENVDVEVSKSNAFSKIPRCSSYEEVVKQWCTGDHEKGLTLPLKDWTIDMRSVHKVKKTYANRKLVGTEFLRLGKEVFESLYRELDQNRPLEVISSGIVQP